MNPQHMLAHKEVYFKLFENDEVYAWLERSVAMLNKYALLLRQRGG